MSTKAPATDTIEYAANHMGISVRMARALTGSHKPMVVVKSLTPRGAYYNIPVTTGAVTVDQTSKDFRRSVSFVTNGVNLEHPDGSTYNLVPLNDYDALNIYGQHLFIYRGVLWDETKIDPKLWTAKPALAPELMAPANGAYELVSLGVFRINTVEIEEQVDGQINITVTGTDVSNNIARNHWTSPVTVWNKPYKVPIAKTDTTAEQTYVANTIQEAIKILIRNRWPVRHPVFGEPQFGFAGVQNHVLEHPVIMGATTVTSSGSNSPWTDISALADAIGAQLYVDRNGKFALKTVPDPNTVPSVWKFLDGEGGLLITADRKLDDSKSMNYVIATGENSHIKKTAANKPTLAQQLAALQTGGGTAAVTKTPKGGAKPLKAIAFDGDPNSPTYYLGEYGRVVGYEPGRKKLTTIEMVQNAANTYLNWFVGGDETTTFTGICNPALDVGDTVSVRRRRVGIFNTEAVIGDLRADTGQPKFIDYINTNALKNPVSKGDILTLYTDAGKDNVTVAAHAPAGAKTVRIVPVKLHRNYRQGTSILDPKIPTDGSVAYFIDKLVIPLEEGTAMQVTCRERRTGSKQDAVRVAEYSTGY